MSHTRHPVDCGECRLWEPCRVATKAASYHEAPFGEMVAQLSELFEDGHAHARQRQEYKPCAVVQPVRMPACHAGGRWFEARSCQSRLHRRLERLRCRFIFLRRALRKWNSCKDSSSGRIRFDFDLALELPQPLAHSSNADTRTSRLNFA